MYKKGHHSLGKPVYRKGLIIRTVNLEDFQEAMKSETDAPLLGAVKGDQTYEGYNPEHEFPVKNPHTGMPLSVRTNSEWFWLVFTNKATGETTELHPFPNTGIGKQHLNTWLRFSKSLPDTMVEVWLIGRDIGLKKEEDGNDGDSDS